MTLIKPVSYTHLYQPQLLFNDYKQGMKLSHELVQQLNSCDSFELSIAFISMSGLATIKQTLLDLEEKNIPGKIITSTYLGFNEPRTFQELLKFKNLDVRIYDDEKAGFHPKGYIFKKEKMCIRDRPNAGTSLASMAIFA